MGPATEEQIKYINTFSGTRRMKRDVNALMTLYKGKHGLNENYGIEGEFFCKEDGNCGQNNDASVLDHNTPAKTQPGLWCQWVLNENGTELEWDGGEKFYAYIDWLKYLIENFFEKWGIKLNGEIKWQGEDNGDVGKIIVRDNKVSIAKIRYEEIQEDEEEA
jgi:hypothetical protein